MALQGSGPISFSQISSEFGLPSGRNLGAYRISETIGSLSNMPLDNGIPQSGAIRFSDFYSKRLNMVVNYYDGPNPRYRVDGRRRYINRPQDVRCIGGFRSRPLNSSNTKVFLNVNVTIGSVKSNDTRYVALRTGTWDSGTTLQVDVGSNGKIFGAGGDGGRSGNPCQGTENGGNGGNGTSAIGIEYSGTTIINRGYIQCGFGGGGGGGTGSGINGFVIEGAAGGAGGGGAGFPSGLGGGGGSGCLFPSGLGGGGLKVIQSGEDGDDGTQTGGGTGGNGGLTVGCAGGDGGSGGDPGNSAGNGESGSGTIPTGVPYYLPIGSGGSAGANGYAIVSSVGGSFSVTNFGTISGGNLFDSVL